MGIFSIDNAFGRFMDKVWKCIILNIIFLICCIPIITAGPALTALFSVLMKLVRDENVAVIKDYFEAFKRNFKQAFVIHMMLIIAAVALFLNLYYGRQLRKEYEIYKYWQYLMYVITFVYLMVLLYVYPLLAAFENTVRGTLQNALLLPITHIWWTLLMMAVTIIPLYLCYINVNIMEWGLLIYTFGGFAGIAYIHSLIFKRIFAQYLKTNDKD